MRTITVRRLAAALLLNAAVLWSAASATDVVTHYEYDNAGQVIRQYVEVDEIVLSDKRMEYDLLGRAFRTRELADPATGTTDDTQDRIYETQWGWAGNVSLERRRCDTGSVFADGAETYYGYDGRNHLMLTSVFVSAEPYDPESGEDPVWVSADTYYWYDGRGNLVEMEDPAHNVSTFAFDAASRQIQELRYQGASALVLQVDSLYDGRGNKVGQVERDPTTQPGAPLTQRRWQYDALGRLSRQVQMASPASTDDPQLGLDRVTDYTYDSGSDRPETVTTYGGDSGTPRTTRYVYDGLGRPTQITDPNGNTQDLAYKPVGAMGEGQLASRTVTNPGLTDPDETDISQQRFEYGYDGLGRRTTETAKGKTAPQDLTTSYDYDGLDRCTKVTNPRRIVTQYQYNAFGDQTQIIEDLDGLARTTDMHYDQLGRLDLQTTCDEDNHTEETAYAYDLADRRTGITFPDGHGYTYTYDDAGRLTGRTDPRGQATAYTNNWRGQPLTRTVDGTLKESFSYYPTGWMKAAWMDAATLAAATNKSEFTCDAFGQTTSVTQTVDGVARTIGCEFYACGERRQMTYPTDVAVALKYTYDNLGQTTAITRRVGSGSFDPLANYTYAGRALTSRDITTAASGGGTHICYKVGLDVHRRQVRLANKSIVGAAATLLDQYDYTYDANGNRQTAAISGCAWLGASTTYGYDDLDRVTGANYGTGIGSESFAYDRLGNRRGDTAGYTDRQGRVSTYQHNQVNEYTGITVAGQAGTPVHDLAGNLTGNGSGYGFTYDYENRLVRVFTDTNGNGIQDAGETVLADYTYDALGRRVRQVKDGQTTLFYYDGQTVLAEYSGSGSLLRYHVHGPTYVDEHVVLHEAGQTPDPDREYYYLLTSLYSVSGLANPAGQVVERYRYDAYGAPTCLAINGGYGDFNSDGKVDLQDFLVFQVAFSGDAPCGESGRVCDANGDGKVNLEDYRAFDAARTGSGGGGGGEATAGVSPFRFTGQPLDFQLTNAAGRPTLVLYHYRARAYDAYNGRFLQRDPAEYADSLNLYEYVRSQPLTASDPTGRFGAYLYAEAEDAEVSIGALAYARFVAGAAMARNFLVSVAIATANGIDRVAASAAWQEIVRFSSNLADKAQAIKDGFRDALNRDNSGTTGGPNDPWERHHQLPKQFEEKFRNAGLDIDDYIIDIPQALHRLKPNGLHTGSGEANWSQVWEAFFDKYPNATKQQILDKLGQMRIDFGLE